MATKLATQHFTIANFKQFKSKQAAGAQLGNWMYVGRKNSYYNLAQSPLANPYNRRQHGGKEKAIKHYRKWLWEQIQDRDEAVMGALQQLVDDPTITLVCWCHPEPCHSEVIWKAVKWLRNIKQAVAPLKARA